MDNKDEFQALFNFLKDFVAPLLGGALKIAIEVIGTALSVVIRTIGTFIEYIEKAYNAVKKLIDFVRNNPITRFFGASDSSGGASYSNAGYFAPSISSTEMARESGAFQGGTTINVTGAIDPESVARQINDILTNSAARGGGATNLVYV